MDTEIVPLADLHEPDRNVRFHPEAQIVELMRAVDMFGQTRPVIVDEANVVLAGNGLVTAMQRLGRKDAEVLRMPHLTAAAKTKLMLSDNKIYTLGHDDYDGIMTLIRGLDDLDVPGFDEDLLSSLIGSDVAASDALAGFGRLSDEEKDQKTNAKFAHPAKANGETTVSCPHCGKAFTLR